MEQLTELAEWIKGSDACVVFTGAGMSTESGLPDFRSQTGLWRGQDPAKLASTHAMHHNREAFVEFYRKRIASLQFCQPHAGHELLASWEKRGRVRGVITQNVDGFHQRAGSQAGDRKPRAYFAGWLGGPCDFGAADRHDFAAGRKNYKSLKLPLDFLC